MKTNVIKKFIIVLVLLMLCSFSFAQNIKIIGNIPRADTGKVYQLQIGAYRLVVNVNKAANALSKNGFTPHYEKIGELVRVFVIVNAADVRAVVTRLEKAGFKEVVIREYTGKSADAVEAPPVTVKPAETKSEEQKPEAPEEPTIIPPTDEEPWEEDILEEFEEIEELEEIVEIEEFEEIEEVEEIEEAEEIEFDDYEADEYGETEEFEEPEHDLAHIYEGE